MADPAKINLNTVKRGDTYIVDFFFTDTDGTKDISAITIDAQARREMDGALWFDLKPKKTDATNGHFRIHLTHEDTRSITESPPGSFSGIFDIQFSWAGADETYVSTVVAGSVSISKDVTQPTSLVSSSGSGPLPAPNQEINLYYNLNPGSPNYSDVVTAEELTPVQYDLVASLGLANINAINEVGEAVAVAKKAASEALVSEKAAKQSEQISTIQAATAKSEAAKAKESADDAAAVVTGGTATLLSAPGKIPLANSEGKIDDDWLGWQKYAMPEAEFKALQEKCIRDNAGSGFLEWGKHTNSINDREWTPVNQGMSSATNIKGILRLGKDPAGSNVGGISRTFYPIVNINGVHHKIATVVTGTDESYARFPDAEQGTRSYDTAAGVVTVHADVATAFAAETATNKVILSRQDYVFIESWHELVADKDVHIPLGNVQYGAATDEDGVSVPPLTGLGIAQGYSAFGEWDTNTVGRGKKWSTMSDTEKQRVVSNPDNNYYMSIDGLVQVRYRIRVVRGLGDNWEGVHPNTSTTLQYGSVSRIQAQATGTSTPAMTPTESYLGIDSTRTSIGEKGSGAFVARDSRTGGAYNGLAFALPIALVQRGNQGAYHPVYNVNGYNVLTQTDGSSGRSWWQPNAHKPTSTLECFSYAHASAGTISSEATGRTDQYEFYDAIYAGQVQDLRLNANKQDYSRLLENRIHKAVAGETRGKGKVPFSTVYDDAGTGDHAVASRKWYAEVNNSIKVYVDTSVGDYEIGDSFYLYDATANLAIRGVVSYVDNNANLFGCNEGFWDTVLGTKPTIGDSGTGNEVYYILEKELSAEYDSLPWKDIIGTPEAILNEFPNGVVGQWIPVIPPTSGNGTFPHRRKLNKLYGRALLNTVTGAWSYSPSPTGTNQITNETVQSYRPTHLVIYDYESLSDFTESDSNLAVVGKLGDVVHTSANAPNAGNRLHPSLIGTVGTDDQNWPSPTDVSYGHLTLNTYQTQQDNYLRVGSAEPTHTPRGTGTPNNNSDAVKALYHLVEKDGLLYLQYHGSQLIYDTPAYVTQTETFRGWTKGVYYYVTNGAWRGLYRCDISVSTDLLNVAWIRTEEGHIRNRSSGAVILYNLPYTKEAGWGDDSSVPVVDNESTRTDLNGNTVKTFTHTELMPIGIADHTLGN